MYTLTPAGKMEIHRLWYFPHFPFRSSTSDENIAIWAVTRIYLHMEIRYGLSAYIYRYVIVARMCNERWICNGVGCNIVVIVLRYVLWHCYGMLCYANYVMAV